MGQVAPRCVLCQRYKVVVGYVAAKDQRAKLGLKHRPFSSDSYTEPFKEPYPEGDRASLLACGACDAAEQWPRILRLPIRKKKSSR